MIDLLRRLLAPPYLYAIDPGPLGRWQVVYIVWSIMLVSGATLSIAIWRRRHTDWAVVSGTACVAGLCLLGLRFISPRIDFIPVYARFLLLDVWTARVWPISATVIALLAPLPALLDRRIPAGSPYLDALTGRLAPTSPVLPRWQTGLGLIIHMFGLSWLEHSGGWPLWWAPLTLLLLLILPLLARPRRIRIETLTPLLISYLVSLVVNFIQKELKIDVEAYQGFRLPDPLSPWFNTPVMIAVGIGYTVWIQIRYLGAGWRRRARIDLLPAGILTLTLVWFGITAFRHRTHGVTASDPYCYVQMAIDLTETGSPLHAFPLAGLARDLGLPTWPTVHIGYHPPTDGIRAPTMWPPGWPLLMVPLYRFGGIDALYWAAPSTALLALVATWALVNEALRTHKRAVRQTVAALTCFLVATSPEGAERMLVPMADAAAQLFTVLTLWLLLRANRPQSPIRRAWLDSALAGFCLGWAYLIRHPQLPLAAAAIVLFFCSHRPFKMRLGQLFAFGTMALLVAIPDLVYHHITFGHWLTGESTEWFLLSPTNIPRTLIALLESGLLRREEIGFMLPFFPIGVAWLGRKNRLSGLILAIGTGAVLLFHLGYAALRPRDLIALLPVFYLCTAGGFTCTLERILKHRLVSAAFLVLCCMTLLLARSYRSLALSWQNETITFGYLSAEQRAALDTLARLTPADAVIGSMLNSGAIELYARREAVHPFPWTEEELRTWLHTLAAQNRPFYLLDDGEEQQVVIERLQAQARFVHVGYLSVPYFAYGGGNLPRTARLYRVELVP